MNILTFSDHSASAPRIERVRHVTRTRTVHVSKTEQLTPCMLRITFCGEDLADFISLAPDDHLKIFVPAISGSNVRRDYTPRRYDAQARTLVVDFALHDAGPASQWARLARSGDVLQIGGPKSSSVITSPIHRWLLIGDETALPAIGRRIEEARAGTFITGIVAVQGAEDQQSFKTEANLTMHWVHRPLSAASDPRSVLDIVKAIDLKPDTFAWIAAEAHVARSIRAWLIEMIGYPRNWLKAGGYWVVGKADTYDRLEG